MTNVKVGQINYFNNQPLKNNGGKASFEQSHEATLGKFFSVVRTSYTGIVPGQLFLV